jgi:hypothetical protein
MQPEAGGSTRGRRQYEQRQEAVEPEARKSTNRGRRKYKQRQEAVQPGSKKEGKHTKASTRAVGLHCGARRAAAAAA